MVISNNSLCKKTFDFIEQKAKEKTAIQTSEENYAYVAHHKAICDELSELYTKKNKAYGNSFSNSYEKYGLVMSAIRLSDKMNRFETLIKDNTIDTFNESVRDTLIDAANYCIMTVMEMDNRQ